MPSARDRLTKLQQEAYDAIASVIPDMSPGKPEQAAPANQNPITISSGGNNIYIGCVFSYPPAEVSTKEATPKEKDSKAKDACSPNSLLSMS